MWPVVLSVLACSALAADYAVVFDCGSSGSRAYIYYNTTGTVAQFTPSDSADEDLLTIEPGISAYVGDPDGLKTAWAGLLSQVKRWVPSTDLATMPVLAHATGGMRMLTEASQAGVWTVVKDATESAGFLKGSFYTIAGNYEGLFGWLAVNYIMGRFSASIPNNMPPFGALDLGGATTQITFIPETGTITQSAIRLDTQFGPSNSLTRAYTHSYTRLGQDEGLLRLAQLLHDQGDTSAPVQNPCHNPGYNTTYNGVLHVGTGDYDACAALTKTMLHTEYECLDEPCAAFGVYQPPISSEHMFYAVSAYWYTVENLGLTGWNEPWIGTLTAIAEAGKTFCARAWSEVESNYRIPTCFASSHIVNLLSVYGFASDTTQITFARKINGFSAEWSLGALLYSLMNEQDSFRLDTCGDVKALYKANACCGQPQKKLLGR